MKKTLWLGILVIAVVGGIAFLKNRGERTAQATSQCASAVAVDVAVPTRCTLRRVVEVFGSLSPKTTTEVKSEIPGRISMVMVKEWDHVHEQAVLLQIDPTDLRLELNRNEAGLKMARALLTQAGVDLNRARREWNRALKLQEGGLITGQEVDDRKSALELAESKVKLADAQVAQAQSQVGESSHTLGKTTISTPIDGTISQRAVDVGDFVDKGGLLFKIVDNRVLDFTAVVPATDLSQMIEGLPLDFTVDGLPDRTFRGRIKRVNPMVRSSDRSGRILAEVENSDGVLKGGLYARGRVVVEEHDDAMTLPKAALTEWDLDKKTARVFVVDNEGFARLRQIATGLAGTDMVEVRSGLAGNEKAVVRGGFNLREGDKTLVANPDSPAS